MSFPGAFGQGTNPQGQTVFGFPPNYKFNRIALDGVTKTIYPQDGGAVLLSGSTATTLNLPQNAPDGLSLEILNPSGTVVTLQGNGYNIAGASTLNITSGITLQFTYDQGWQVGSTAGGSPAGDIRYVKVKNTIGLLRNRPFTIIPAGDSITQQGSVLSGTVWQYASGYAETSIRLAGIWDEIANAGISGNTSSQLLARFQTDVINPKPSACLLLIGTNDFYAGDVNSTYQLLFNNIEQMVLSCIGNGILPIIVTPPTKNSAPLVARNAQWFYYSLARAYGLPLLPIFPIVTDPASGNYIAADSADGTHPNQVGIAAIAAQFGPALSNPNSLYCPQYFASVAETSGGNPANLIQNGNFATQTTAGIPDGWSINTTGASYVCTATSPYPYAGKDFVYTKTATGDAYALFGPTTSSGFSPGDVLEFSGEIIASGLTSSSGGFNLGIDFANAGGTTGSARAFSSWNQNGSFPFTVEFTVPPTSDRFTPLFFVHDGGTAYTVRNLTVINRTVRNAIWKPGQQTLFN